MFCLHLHRHLPTFTFLAKAPITWFPPFTYGAWDSDSIHPLHSFPFSYNPAVSTAMNIPAPPTFFFDALEVQRSRYLGTFASGICRENPYLKGHGWFLTAFRAEIQLGETCTLLLGTVVNLLPRGLVLFPSNVAESLWLLQKAIWEFDSYHQRLHSKIAGGCLVPLICSLTSTQTLRLSCPPPSDTSHVHTHNNKTFLVQFFLFINWLNPLNSFISVAILWDMKGWVCNLPTAKW